MSNTFNNIEMNAMIFNGVEVESWIHNGVEVYAGLSGKFIIENGVLNTKFATGEYEVSSSYKGNAVGGTKTVSLMLNDKVIGRPMRLTLSGWVSGSCFNGQISRMAYVSCDGTKLVTIDLNIHAGGSSDKTVTVDFTPTTNLIEVGIHLTREYKEEQSTQIDTQNSKIIDLQIL